VDGRILQQLFALFPPTSLFPNLHAFDFSQDSNFDFSLLRQFLSPELAFLGFCIPSGTLAHDVEKLVDALPEAAPGLQQLAISVDRDGSPIRQVHLPLTKIPKLNTLLVLENSCLAKHNIADIEHLHFLETLALTLQRGSDAVDDSPSGDMPFQFSSLKCLALNADCLQHCTTFLRRFGGPKLSSITIEYEKRALPEEVAEFFLSLHTSCPDFASLETISVRRYGDLWDLDLPNPLPSRVFRPLFKYRRLTTAKVSGIGQYCLDDDFLEDLTVACPDIHITFTTTKYQEELANL